MSALQNRIDPVSRVHYPSVAEFERGEMDPADFVHAAHVYVAWQLLDQFTLLESIQRFAAALRRFTKAIGQESKYHETITWFFVLLISERKSANESWDEFAAANEKLISDSKSILKQHYSEERLWSDLARRQFLLPDRIANNQDTCAPR